MTILPFSMVGGVAALWLRGLYSSLSGSVGFIGCATTVGISGTRSSTALRSGVAPS